MSAAGIANSQLKMEPGIMCTVENVHKIRLFWLEQTFPLYLLREIIILFKSYPPIIWLLSLFLND